MSCCYGHGRRCRRCRVDTGGRVHAISKVLCHYRASWKAVFSLSLITAVVNSVGVNTFTRSHPRSQRKIIQTHCATSHVEHSRSYRNDKYTKQVYVANYDNNGYTKQSTLDDARVSTDGLPLPPPLPIVEERPSCHLPGARCRPCAVSTCFRHEPFRGKLIIY